MSRNNAAPSERELQQDINAAIAGTEDEIFKDALDGSEDDNDGDTSLEDMGEGLEGDDLETEDESQEEDAEEAVNTDGDVEAEEDEAASEEEVEDEEVEAQATEEEPQPRDQRGRFDRNEPRIPPERLRQETERRRAAEAREQELIQRQQILEARFNDMQARINAPQPSREQTAPPPKPDMFAEPERYEQWVIAQANEQAMQNVARMLASRDEQQRVAFNQRVDQSMAAAASGPRGFEFTAAYNQLKMLNPQDPQHRSIVQNIVYAQDPAAALFDWWEDNGGPEYREAIVAQLTEQPAPRGGQRIVRVPQRSEQQQPRHVIRRAQPMRSLNSASGSSSHRVADPEMLDGSDSSVFDFATRR